MHGQKGGVGFLESQENFPFTHEGIVPDLVINSHAFPTRQTPRQLLEAALGKGIAYKVSVYVNNESKCF
jgi:DNA-directed RNA polymerase II subunit RPB2/DNA-directed RNA polymerase-4/5 subunit 2